MTHERDGATVTGDRSRADVLSRLARSTDPDTDDLSRARRIRVALTELGCPALLIDLDGTVLDGNDQAAELGIDREQLRGRALWTASLWHLDDAVAILSPLVEAAAQGRAGQRTIDTRGTAAVPTRPLRVSLTPIVDEGGHTPPSCSSSSGA